MATSVPHHDIPTEGKNTVRGLSDFSPAMSDSLEQRKDKKEEESI